MQARGQRLPNKRTGVCGKITKGGEEFLREIARPNKKNHSGQIVGTGLATLGVLGGLVLGRPGHQVRHGRRVGGPHLGGVRGPDLGQISVEVREPGLLFLT